MNYSLCGRRKNKKTVVASHQLRHTRLPLEFVDNQYPLHSPKFWFQVWWTNKTYTIHTHLQVFAFRPLKFKLLCQHFLKCTLKIVYYSQIIKQGLQDMQDQLWYKIKIIHPFQNAEKSLENFLTHIPEKLVKTKIVFFLHSRKSSTIPCVCDEGWTFDPANIDVWCCYDRTDWLTFSYVKKKIDIDECHLVQGLLSHCREGAPVRFVEIRPATLAARAFRRVWLDC